MIYFLLRTLFLFIGYAIGLLLVIIIFNFVAGMIFNLLGWKENVFVRANKNIFKIIKIVKRKKKNYDNN